MTRDLHPAGPLLGAYAMAPADADGADAFYAALAELPIGGLEMPAPTAGADLGAEGLLRRLQPGWLVMLTCVPGVVAQRGVDRAHGLASSDEAARERALADVARTAELARRLADLDGAERVAAIEVHSSPGPGLGSVDAFARSLETIAGWDLAGAQIVVEHCDALVPGQRAAKGFLTLADEIVAIRAAGSPQAVGIGINWGRSAIEGRSARTPVEHVAAATESGLLRAVVLSGATGAETAWGPAWGDAHIPSRGSDPALAGSVDSLLGDAEIAATLGVAAPDALVAVKVAVRPRDADVAHRVAVARAVLAQVAAHRDA